MFNLKYAYKIVAAICALAVIVAAIFLPLVYISFESLLPSVLLVLGSYLKNDATAEILESTNGEIPRSISENIAIKDIFSPNVNSIAEAISGLGKDVPETAAAAIEALLPPVITFVVVLALILICALITAIIAIVTKNNRNVIYSSITGIGLCLMLPETFEAVAAPFINGDISLSTLSGSALLSLLGTVSKLELTSTFWFIPIIFACVILWTILYNATLPENEKRERKIMLGEADK